MQKRGGRDGIARKWRCGMTGLPGYDAWKLATPPEYDVAECPECGSQNYRKTRFSSECPDCDHYEWHYKTQRRGEEE